MDAALLAASLPSSAWATHQGAACRQQRRPRPTPTRSVRVHAQAPCQQHQHHHQHQQHAHDLSVVLLVNENVRRQAGGRALLERAQLLEAVQLLEAADYAVLVFGGREGRDLVYANHAASTALQQPGCDPQQLPALQQLHMPQAVVTALEQQQQQQQGCSQAVLLEDVGWQLTEQQQPGGTGSAPGQQLLVQQLLVLPLVSPNDAPFGAALLFDAWRYSGGAVGLPGWPAVLPHELPSQQQLQEAGDAVRQQADAVRALKQEHGLSNKDAAVVAAVSELQTRKQRLERLEGLQQAFQSNKRSQLQGVVDALRSSSAGGQAPAAPTKKS